MNIALDHRTKVIIGAVVMVLIIVAGWFLGAQPQLSQAAIASEQTATVTAANVAAQERLVSLAAENEELPALQQQLAELSASIPASANTSAMLTDINAIAAASGVTVDGVAFDAAASYATAADADPSAPVTADPLAPYSDSRITSANFISIPVRVDVTGSYDAVLSFLAGVQGGTRLFLVNNFSSTRNAASGEDAAAASVSATVGGYVYVLVDASTVVPPAAAG